MGPSLRQRGLDLDAFQAACEGTAKHHVFPAHPPFSSRADCVFPHVNELTHVFLKITWASFQSRQRLCVGKLILRMDPAVFYSQN